MSSELPIAVIGAGLTGSIVALMLAQQGFSVLVVERRGDPRSQYEAEQGAQYAVCGELVSPRVVLLVSLSLPHCFAV